MPTANAAPTERSFSRRKLLVLAFAGLLVLLLIGVFGGRAWVQGYLRSDKFRQFIDRKAGKSLDAQAELAPLHVSGQSFHSDSFQAKGYEDSWFSDLRLEQLRADLSTRRFSERVWQVDQVLVERAELKIDGERIPRPPKTRTDAAGDGEFRTPDFLGDLLPNRVEIADATIKEASLTWKDGGVQKTVLNAVPQDGGWLFQANGGTVTHGSLPSADLTRVRIRLKEPSLFVQEAELRPTTGGSINVTGEVKLRDSLDLLAKIENVSMSPYLDGDWRARLSGKVSGDVRVKGTLQGGAPPLVTGTLNLQEGRLEALPILDTIAIFTRAKQFRKLHLTSATADFRQEGERLEVTRFTVESAGLIKMEGSFTVVSGQIDGLVQLGVTPSSLQWLPGSQERVFTASRDGYLWSPVRLTGPASKPKEDLSPRLAAAAKDALFGTAEGSAQDATDSAKDLLKGARDAAKSAVDALLGR